MLPKYIYIKKIYIYTLWGGNSNSASSHHHIVDQFSYNDMLPSLSFLTYFINEHVFSSNAFVKHDFNLERFQISNAKLAQECTVLCDCYFNFPEVILNYA